MKKILALALAVLMLLCVGCGNDNTTDTEGKKTYTVGICQLLQHEALDAATKGFKDALVEEFGDAITFDEQNASGESANCATIVNKFVSNNVDLILANATPALQAAASATEDIPILGTSISHYATALEISDWTGTVGGNISGTSDLAPLDQQAAMIKEWFPDVTKVGLIYCSAEANSLYQVDTITAELQKLGVETKKFAFADSNDAATVAKAAADYSKVCYIPTDNVAADNAESIANVLSPEGAAAIVGEGGICKGCGVAALTISYYDLGVATGKMAAKILKGEADVSTMPVETLAKVTKVYNPTICEELGLTVPEGYVSVFDN